MVLYMSSRAPSQTKPYAGVVADRIDRENSDSLQTLIETLDTRKAMLLTETRKIDAEYQAALT